MAEIKQLKEGNKVIYPLTSTKAIVNDDGKRVAIPTKISELENDSGYVSAIPNLLKNTNFGDGFNGWTRSGSVTIKNDVYEGIGAAYIDGGGMIGQDVTLDASVYTLSFRVANSSINEEYPLKVLLRRANVSNVVTNARGWSNDDVPTIFVTSVSDKVYITFTLTSASNINIEFENSRYGCLVDSIRLEEGDTANAYDEYLMQKRLVSGLNMATVNGQSLLNGGDITINNTSLAIGSGLETSEIDGKLTLSLGSGLEFTDLGEASIKLGLGLMHQDDGSVVVSTSYIADHSGSLKLGTGLFKNSDGEIGLTTAVGLYVSDYDKHLKIKVSTQLNNNYGAAGLFCGTNMANSQYDGLLGIGLALSTEDCPFTFKEGMKIVDNRGMVIGTQSYGCAGLAFNYSDDFFINNNGQLCLATHLKP